MSVSYVEIVVGTVDAVIATADPSRTYALVSNPTANHLYIAFGQTAVVGQSCLIPAGGAPVAFSSEVIGTLIQGTIHAIFATAAGKMAVILGKNT